MLVGDMSLSPMMTMTGPCSLHQPWGKKTSNPGITRWPQQPLSLRSQPWSSLGPPCLSSLLRLKSEVSCVSTLPPLPGVHGLSPQPLFQLPAPPAPPAVSGCSWSRPHVLCALAGISSLTVRRRHEKTRAVDTPHVLPSFHFETPLPPHPALLAPASRKSWLGFLHRETDIWLLRLTSWPSGFPVSLSYIFSFSSLLSPSCLKVYAAIPQPNKTSPCRGPPG